MYFRRRKVQDPILGEIALDELTNALISTDIMKRLYFIKKLDLANLIYPNATHTYFGHALGTMVLAEKASEKFHLSSEETRHLKVASMLSDSCIYPFQTVMEMLPSLVPPYRAHPRLEDIILRSEITDILKLYGIDSKRVLSIILSQDENEILNQILNGPFSLGYLDSVVRDSYYLGFSGDTQVAIRILDQLTIVELGDKEWIATTQKAVPDIQRLLITRDQLFQEVYHNTKVLSLRLMLRKILEPLLIRKALASYDLAAMSDEDLLVFLKEHLKGKLRALLKDLLNLKFFQLFFSSKIYFRPEIGSKFWSNSMEDLERNLEQKVIEQGHIDTTYIAIKVSPFRVFEENNIPILVEDHITDIRRFSPMIVKQEQDDVNSQGIRCFASHRLSSRKQTGLREIVTKYLGFADH